MAENQSDEEFFVFKTPIYGIRALARTLIASTPDYERIFNLRFMTINEMGDRLEKRLVVEIMGRHSNIILLNHEDRILDAILHIDESISRVREVMPARPYRLPPTQNKLTPRQILDSISSGDDWLGPTVLNRGLEKALLERLQGFSPQLCHEVADRAFLDGRIQISRLDQSALARLNRVMLDLCQKIDSGAFAPATFYDHAEAQIPIDFHALTLTSFAISRPESSVSEAMDRFYLERDRQNTFKQKRQHLDKLISQQITHARRKLDIHEKDQQEGSRSETYKRWGELILANLHQIRDDQDVLAVTDYYDPEMAEIEIPLEPGRTAAQMAKIYFRRYTKARTRLETGQRLAAEDRDELTWLDSLSRALDNAADMDDLRAIAREVRQTGIGRHGKDPDSRDEAEPAGPDLSGGQKPGRRRSKNKPNGRTTKKARRSSDEAPLPPRRFTSSDGLTILVGRNNYQNDQLTLKTAQKDDLWLHVQHLPGTHVIVRSEKSEVPEQTLLEAAGLAAWYSRSGRDGQPAVGSGHKVAVDYCPAAHVRKPSGARPGMVIYDRYQTLLVEPLNPDQLVRSEPNHNEAVT
ncbi:MAG: NFACT RNA binding domain-containing protein [Eubacteriales bacterium]|nr:NFACT RNA binding domain-containing protein [Eubacteriales bacterium]